MAEKEVSGKDRARMLTMGQDEKPAAKAPAPKAAEPEVKKDETDGEES